jgi:hypothetical protein
MKRAAAILVLAGALATAPVSAADYSYAPENCEFRMTFPGEPYKTRRCQADAPDVCRDMTSYTKVFGIDATVNVNVTCNKAEDKMYERYSGDVMQATLAAIMGENHLEDYQTGYQEFDVAKQAVLMGMGKTGSSDKIFIAQLWIGHKSVLSVEAELVGGPLEEADKMFSDILHSIRHESWKDGGPPEKAVDKTVDKAAPKPAEKEETPAPAPDAAPQDKKSTPSP